VKRARINERENKAALELFRPPAEPGPELLELTGQSLSEIQRSWPASWRRVSDRVLFAALEAGLKAGIIECRKDARCGDQYRGTLRREDVGAT